MSVDVNGYKCVNAVACKREHHVMCAIRHNRKTDTITEKESSNFSRQTFCFYPAANTVRCIKPV